MKYLRVPHAISSRDLHTQAASWSPSMYERVEIGNQRTTEIGNLLSSYEKGSDPGSLYYLRKSTHYLIRTKALQEHSSLIYPKGDAITPLNPKAFEDASLSDGDILLSKDSNIGECAMVDGNGWRKFAISGGVVRLRAKIDRYYLFAFLKHALFRDELHSMVPRGATIAHANELWLRCKIPFPNQPDAERVEKYVSVLMRAIVEKERAIRERNAEIDDFIGKEIGNNAQGRRFTYQFPTRSSVASSLRFDAAVYSRAFCESIARINAYRHGCGSYIDHGFTIRRGQNLQISSIGLSIYSGVQKSGFYRLVAPSDISEFRTVRAFRFLGNKKRLECLQKGDVIFGAEGFGKGRSIALVDQVSETISNIHGVIFHPVDNMMTRGIVLSCFLGYMRRIGLVDAIGAGGSGGSLAIGYLDQLPIPRFPDDVQSAIARFYHAPASDEPGPQTLTDFVEYHRVRNSKLGIWELDSEMKSLQSELLSVQERIIQGHTVAVTLRD